MSYAFTAREKFNEVKRVTPVLATLYDRLVQVGPMSRNVADRRLDLMRAIAEDYVTLMLRGAMKEDQADTARRQERGEILPDKTTILSGG